jgi:hypothetical protein
VAHDYKYQALVFDLVQFLFAKLRYMFLYNAKTAITNIATVIKMNGRMVLAYKPCPALGSNDRVSMRLTIGTYNIVREYTVNTLFITSPSSFGFFSMPNLYTNDGRFIR